MSWASWHAAQKKELAFLDGVAGTVLQRTTQTFRNIRLSLDKVGRTNVPACSKAHIDMMRDEVINSQFIEEIGFFADNLLRCTSWGNTEQYTHQRVADFVTSNGLSVTLRVKPAASFSNQLIAIYLGDYGALVNPGRLVDIAVNDKVSVAILADNGQLLSSRNNPDLVLAETMATNSRLPSNGHLIVSVQREDGFTAVVMEKNPDLTSQLADELKVFLPVGALMGMVFVGVVFLALRYRLSMQAELEIAIKQRELVVHYQPIIELNSGICVGAEALVRWQRPDGTIVRPDIFIPIAEETGLIEPLTDRVIEVVVSELQHHLVHDKSLHVAINVSAPDMQSGRVLDVIDQKLHNTGVNKEQIWLEATERGFIDVRAARSMLERARQAGYSVALDDFGTGYSSLQYLQGLPLDALKIDKSFVEAIGKETATSSVIVHIIDMAKDLGLFCVAEGVETAEQEAFLKHRGVEYGQGWLYSMPLPAADFITYQQARKKAFGLASNKIHVDKQR
ncbi:EAL domain-containing protein [Brucella anthropi]|uniref:EAL domain-containing protein n=1 Tax=Brucella anthropi TaxID=529 RepID=UPI00296E388A|nr:EAL domain-containing protein [Ochrobactrum sp. MYb49]